MRKSEYFVSVLSPKYSLYPLFFYFEEAYESYVAENSGKQNLSEEECREILREIHGEGKEL